jgi:hypothetical protein
VTSRPDPKIPLAFAAAIALALWALIHIAARHLV